MTADEKSSADAVGAARRYSGTVGGAALCQVAVTVTYATSRGHALIGRALYLPEGCAADEQSAAVAALIERAVTAYLPLIWGVGDARADAPPRVHLKAHQAKDHLDHGPRGPSVVW